MSKIYIIEIYQIINPYTLNLYGVFDEIFPSYDSAEKKLLSFPEIIKQDTFTFNRYISADKVYSIKEIKCGVVNNE